MRILSILLCTLLAVACYNGTPDNAVVETDTCNVCGQPLAEVDTLSGDSVVSRALYGEGFNFRVVVDSLLLQAEEPLLNTSGTFTMKLVQGDAVVVAGREVIETDSLDTVWVRVARDQYTMGWVREGDLLSAVVPDTPISLFIYTFSNQHLIYFLATVALVCFVLLVRRHMKCHNRMVHFQDIPSPYPTLLCVTFAASAVFYACIQRFAPAVWQQFYFAPTLNPFGLHPLPCAFISSVWVVLILSIAMLDDVVRLLSPSQAAVYLLSTLGWCMGLYTIFSLAPLVWMAIPGFIIYAVWAAVRYYRHSRPTCLCGQCGKPMHSSHGACPWCGAING